MGNLYGNSESDPVADSLRRQGLYDSAPSVIAFKPDARGIRAQSPDEYIARNAIEQGADVSANGQNLKHMNLGNAKDHFDTESDALHFLRKVPVVNALVDLFLGSGDTAADNNEALVKYGQLNSPDTYITGNIPGQKRAPTAGAASPTELYLDYLARHRGGN